LWINGIRTCSPSTNLSICVTLSVNPQLTKQQLGVERPYYGKCALMKTLTFFDRSSSIAVEDLLQNYKPKRPRTAIAYYYFSFQTKAEQQFINLLRAITFQLSCQCPNLPRSVWRLQYCFNQELSDEYMIDVVKDIVESFPEVYIVIDAFDECEQSEKVLRWIREFAESGNNGLHLLVSSRQDYRFRDALDLSTTLILALDEHIFQKDIQVYIREQLSTDPRMMKWPPSVQNFIEHSLLANSGGL
jgi:hypothetical protein